MCKALYAVWCGNPDWAGTEKGQKHGVFTSGALFLTYPVAYWMLFYLGILGKLKYQVNRFVWRGLIWALTNCAVAVSARVLEGSAQHQWRWCWFHCGRLCDVAYGSKHFVIVTTRATLFAVLPGNGFSTCPMTCWTPCTASLSTPATATTACRSTRPPASTRTTSSTSASSGDSLPW